MTNDLFARLQLKVHCALLAVGHPERHRAKQVLRQLGAKHRADRQLVPMVELTHNKYYERVTTISEHVSSLVRETAEVGPRVPTHSCHLLPPTVSGCCSCSLHAPLSRAHTGGHCQWRDSCKESCSDSSKCAPTHQPAVPGACSVSASWTRVLPIMTDIL